MDDFYKNGGQNGDYYVPPTQPNGYNQNQQQGGYYYQNNQQPYQVQVEGYPPVKTKKKKHKGVWILVIIIVVAMSIAVSGLVSSVNKYITNNDSGTKEETTVNDKLNDIEDADEVNDDSDDASANVVGSNEATKTDENGNLTAAGVVEKSIDSCVGITTYAQQNSYSYFYSYGQEEGDDKEVAAGEGSGVIMSEANGKTYIMTCAHVIDGASSCKITLNDGSEYDATIVGTDSQTDIGVLSIKKTGLKIAEFGDSKDIEVGATCVAIGCPAGLQFMNSVTQGIVSAIDRPVSSSIGYKQTCIQVDAAINPGNSGGALFNMQGQVIGINSSKIASTEYEGMGFAVPSNTAVKTANSLIKNGYVAGRAKLGIEYNEISQYNNSDAIISALERKGYKGANGAMVVQNITPESDLNGKLEQYDIIVAVDGDVLTSVDVMTSYLNNHSPKDTCTLTVATVKGNSINIREVKCKLIEAKE